MPHTHTFMSNDARRVLIVINTDWFQERVARSVSEVFGRVTGEKLMPRKQSLAYAPVITNNMPADVIFNVTTWWTPERAHKFRAIERALQEEFGSWNESLTVKVHLIIVGKP